MGFVEKVAICIAGCLGVFFIGLTGLYLSGTPMQRGMGSIAQIGTLDPTATPAPTATPDCRQEIAEYNRSALTPLMKRWEDAFVLANSSPRIALPPQIATLQSIRRELAEGEPAPCAQKTHDQFVEAMDEIIVAFLAFLGQEPDYTVKRHFENATVLLEKVKAAIDESETLE